MDQDRSICVIGAGAVGGWVAARLALAGNRVTALGRDGPVARLVLREKGEVESADMRPPAGPADLLIISVKAPDLLAAAQSAAAFIGPDTMVVPMANGVPWWFADGLGSVDPGGRIADLIPRRQVVGCVVHAACSRDAAGAITVTHADRLIFGEPDSGSDRAAALCALFDQAGIVAEASTDIRRAVWYKLWGNATINPLSALTRATADRLLADPAIRNIMLEAMAELAAVGAAIGCPIEQSGEDRMAVTARLGAFRTSMLQDVEAGRRIELEALLGAPIELARRHGIATPRLDLLYAMTALLGDSLGLL